MIQEVLSKLQELQEILSQKYQIEQEIVDIPKELETKRELLSRLNQQYADLTEKLEQSKNYIAELTEEMRQAEKSREENENRMSVINTQREYEAVLKEIQHFTDLEELCRKKIQREEKYQQELNENIESHTFLLSEQNKEIELGEERVTKELQTRKASLSKLTKSEEKIVPELDRGIIFKFQRIIKSKGGQGIVPLRHSVCLGCNMILPAQFVNEVREEKNVKFCPYCSMILYYISDDSSEDLQFDDLYLDNSDEQSQDFDNELGEFDLEYEEEDVFLDSRVRENQSRQQDDSDFDDSDSESEEESDNELDDESETSIEDIEEDEDEDSVFPDDIENN